MILKAGAESSWSGSHVTTIIHNFTLVSLAFIATPHPAGLPFRATVSFHLTHSTTNSTPHCLHSRKLFPAVGTICILPTCWGNEVIISRTSLNDMEFERLVGRNWVHLSLMQTSASSSILVRVYWLDDKGSLSHWYWSGLLARWWRSVFGMSSGR